MDPQSPPKRMTRARAAAKGTEPATKPTRVITAAARARAMRGTASTSAKRKARDDVDDSDNEEPEPAVVVKAPVAAAVAKPKAPRGRPKKIQDPVPQPEAEAQPAAVAAKPRGRPKKVVAEPPVEEPVKTTRATRAKKADVEAAESAEPPKKTTRGRPPSTLATRTTTIAKSTVKKSVTFDEPEKENMAPAGAPATRAPTKPATATTGLKAKPVRRPATASAPAATRATRGVKTAATGEKPTPLSPKKVNQLTSTHADSDDELAPSDRLATKPLRKNPIRPPGAGKKAAHDVQTSSAAEENASEPSETLPRVILGSPAKKLPQSPFKNCIKSPAKRVEGVLPPSITHTTETGETSQSAFRATLLQSPAKRPPGGKLKGFEFGAMTPGQPGASPFKTSLLLSPAKRAYSPTKPLVLPAFEDEQVTQSPAPKPTLLATPLPGGTEDAEEEDSMVLDEADEASIPDSPTRLRFPGRMSAVLPRHADPAMTSDLVDVVEAAEEGAEAAEQDALTAEQPTPVETQEQQVEGAGDPMAVDSDNEQDDDIDDDATEPDDSAGTTPPVSPPKSAGPMFRLRKEDLQDYDSETDAGSEDEIAPRRKLFPTTGTSTPLQAGFFKTPSSRSAVDATPAGRSTAKRVRTDGKFGFTPLADQLSGWAAGPSPLKLGNYVVEPPSMAASTAAATPLVPDALSPAAEAFFDEAMAGQSDDMVIDTEVDVAAVPDAESPVLEDVAFTEEDVALATEAREMSLMEQEKIEEHVGHSFDDSISEASQEYGDENEMPIDPRLEGEPMVPLTTPRRALNREFHTVSKVPLKPADDSSPILKVKKRGHSISRLPVSRPTHTLTRNATVISYSPTKGKDEDIFEDDGLDDGRDERAGSAPPATPTKSEAGWSLVGTPARTPRLDVDPALLRGAIIFVDVHTSEGADASGIFVELLTQMGARCVKTWTWNPSTDAAQDGCSSKIGITHVVYKDGGKRTLEKVRESGGVVQCVGVSWVLE